MNLQEIVNQLEVIRIELIKLNFEKAQICRKLIEIAEGGRPLTEFGPILEEIESITKHTDEVNQNFAKVEAMAKSLGYVKH